MRLLDYLVEIFSWLNGLLVQSIKNGQGLMTHELRINASLSEENILPSLSLSRLMS